MTAHANSDAVLEWACAGSALEGNDSGDAHVVTSFPGGALVAVIDGLGHGVEAAAAAVEAIRVLRHDPAGPLPALVERCHEALRDTRGAVMSLARFDARASSMTWLGVGNVEAVLARRTAGREGLAARGGVVGFQLPPLRPSTVPVEPGDTLFMVTDGIHSSFMAEIAPHVSPQVAADGILARHARGTDDALVVVARYLGATP